MTYYPIIIPTLNRYEHFRRCVESLARNTHADKTELVIGLDFPPSSKYEEGHRKIKEYIPSIRGFKKVTLFERKENYGAYRNGLALREYVFQNYDAVITTEDDNEFAPCFLDYTNKMLEHYGNDERVASISGFLPTDFYGMSETGILFTKESNGWGNGIWRDKHPDEDERYEIVETIPYSLKSSWRSLITCPSSFRMLLSMVSTHKRWGDISRTQVNIFNNLYQVRPAISLCRNWGIDGTGVNCDNNRNTYNRFIHQQISSDKTFSVPTNWEIYYPKSVARATFWINWPKNKLIFFMKFCITIVKYVAFRLKKQNPCTQDSK